MLLKRTNKNVYYGEQEAKLSLGLIDWLSRV